MYEQGSRVRNTKYGYLGTVDKSIGKDRWLVFADSDKIDHSLPGALPGVPVEADGKDLVPLSHLDIASGIGESRETRAVMMYLHKESRMHHTYADSMGLDTLEMFKRDARRILGDATDVTEEELTGADWEYIYQEIKEEQG
jgi:hypothetical protein